MNRASRLTTGIVLCVTAAAAAGAEPQQQRPHPAVVRVIAPEPGGSSYGSGTLVAANGSYGLVVTNWHVVRDADGPITTVFPDGFRSAATVLTTDRDWDLAALAIWRPATRPVALATEAPQRGDVLTIAGYGRGWYRAAAGRCVQYVSPGRNLPFEMVELGVGARDGDSGGPIFNDRGELAGVLFGAASGRTTGSYCGRVKEFLASAADAMQRMPTVPAQTSPTMLAGRRGPAAVAAANPQPEVRKPTATVAALRAAPRPQRASPEPPAARQLTDLPLPESCQTPTESVSTGPQPDAGPLPSAQPPMLGATRAEQLKSILAAIGAVALLFHGLRLLGAAQRG